MRIIASAVGFLVAFSLLAASPAEPVRTVRSSTSQFIVRGPPLSGVGNDGSPAVSTLIELDPTILAISCERIKQALLRELTLPDLWRGRIYIEINSLLSTNRTPRIIAKAFVDGWHYQMEVPRRIEKPKLVRGLIQALLMEIANRNAGLLYPTFL